MHFVPLSLLFIFIGSSLTKKQGDFGSLTACITKDKKDLRLMCLYGKCEGSPPFYCHFMTINGLLPANSSNMCTITVPDHPVLYANKTSTYFCNLTRKLRTEAKEITVDYGIRTGKHHIKICKDTTGLLLHLAPTVLWPVVILSLWTVLHTNSQTT